MSLGRKKRQIRADLAGKHQEGVNTERGVVALVKPLTPGSLFSDCFPENQLERVV